MPRSIAFIRFRTASWLRWLCSVLLIAMPAEPILASPVLSPACAVDSAAFWSGWPEKTLAALTIAVLMIGKHKESDADIQSVIKSFQPKVGSERAAFENLRGLGYLERGDYAKAREHYEEALKQEGLSDPLRRLLTINMAQLSVIQNDDKRVMELLGELAADECGTLSGPANYWLADAYARAGRTQEAAQFLSEALTDVAEPKVEWLELDVELQCSSGNLQRCAERLVQLARHPRPNPANADWLSEYAVKLASKPASSPLLAQARNEGLFDEQWNIRLKPYVLIEDPVPVKQVAPAYPPQAARTGTQGMISLIGRVATDGTVKKAEVDWAVPPKVFDKNALKAFQQWKFEPRWVDGKLEEYDVIVRIDFRLAQ